MYYLRALNNSRYYNTRQTKKYSSYSGLPWETQNIETVEKNRNTWSVFIVFRVAGSIDRRTFCLSPFALIRPGLRSIIPLPPPSPLSIATLPGRLPRRPLRCSSHPSGNPIRRLLYSYLKYWREAKVVASLALSSRFSRSRLTTTLPPCPPPTAPAVFLPSGCSRRWRWPTSNFVFSQGAEGTKSSERSERETGEIWLGSGEARDHF